MGKKAKILSVIGEIFCVILKGKPVETCLGGSFPGGFLKNLTSPFKFPFFSEQNHRRKTTLPIKAQGVQEKGIGVILHYTYGEARAKEPEGNPELGEGLPQTLTSETHHKVKFPCKPA